MVSFTLATLSILLHTLSVAAAPNDLAARQGGPISVSAASTTASASETASTTSSANTAILTGTFIVGGGAYDVTSESGYVVVAGHTLTVGGPDALVGGVPVTEASGGFVADGATVPLYTYTAASSTAAASTASTTTAPGAEGASPDASTVSKTAMAAATGVPIAGAAVLGGVMGLMLL